MVCENCKLKEHYICDNNKYMDRTPNWCDCQHRLTPHNVDDNMWVNDPVSGEGAAKCSPSCDLELVRPGKWQCSCWMDTSCVD